MKKSFAVLALGILAVYGQSQTAAPRPRILGIDHVSFYTTQPEGVKKLYDGTLGLTSAAPVEAGEFVRFMVGEQWVGYSNAPDPKATDRMDHVAFTTDNIVGASGVSDREGSKSACGSRDTLDRSLSFTVADPEGHRIEFVERGKC